MNRQELDPKAIQEAADVAADYEGLQGLTAAFQGAALVIMGLTGSVIWGSVLLACSVVFGQGYYYKKYGKASQAPKQILWALVVGIPLLIGTAVAIAADHFMAGPIAFGALAGAICLFGITRLSYRHVGGTHLHTATFIALAASSMLPLVGWPADGAIWRYSVCMIGLAMVVLGAADHVRLARALNPRLGTTRSDADA